MVLVTAQANQPNEKVAAGNRVHTKTGYKKVDLIAQGTNISFDRMLNDPVSDWEKRFEFLSPW
jgi:hypothetical protein